MLGKAIYKSYWAASDPKFLLVKIEFLGSSCCKLVNIVRPDNKTPIRNSIENSAGNYDCINFSITIQQVKSVSIPPKP